MISKQSVDASNAAQLDNWDGDVGAFWAAYADRFDEGVAAYRGPFLAAAAIDETAEAFDVAVSRHGVMFFGDPVAAFTNVARALRPGGRLVLLTWQPFEHNEWLGAFFTALAAGREVPVPPADGRARSP